ncbi:MAG TPA: hypothetical protein VFC67_22320 [Prolixibacteraceae bacterium]|nr:hypothetical protein [Prolixibacteraceae bacterium]
MEKLTSIFSSHDCLQGVAFSVLFTMMPKFDNSSTVVPNELIERNIDLFGIKTIKCLLADREFIAITGGRISI